MVAGTAVLAGLGGCQSSELRIDDLNWDIDPDPIYRETEVRHSRPMADGERFDPQEFDANLVSIFSKADAITERLVGNVRRDEEFALVFWVTKKSLLKQEYNIEWQSPAELNPQLNYGPYGQRLLTENETLFVEQMVVEHLKSSEVTVTRVARSFDGDVNAYSNNGEDFFACSLTGNDVSWELHSCSTLEW